MSTALVISSRRACALPKRDTCTTTVPMTLHGPMPGAVVEQHIGRQPGLKTGAAN
jgi:hypothetical protein